MEELDLGRSLREGEKSLTVEQQMVGFPMRCCPPKRGTKPITGRRESKVAAFGCGGVWVFSVQACRNGLCKSAEGMKQDQIPHCKREGKIT